MRILVAALLVLNIAGQSARATTTFGPSTYAASGVIGSVMSSPTELSIQWSSSMAGGTAGDPAKYASADAAFATSLAGMTPVAGTDGTLVTFRYSRPLVAGTYTLQIAEVQDAAGNLITPSTQTVSLAASPKLLALIAEPNNPFPPGPGMRPISDGWQLVNTPPGTRFASSSAGGEWWLDTGVRIATFGGGDWAVELSAPRGQALVPGVYTNAVRSPFRPAGVPGIDVSGFGMGCNTTTGNFEIRDVAFIDDPRFGRKPVRLDASFDFRCDDFTSRIFGLVRYSQDTTPPVISANITPAPNADGWNNSPVTVTWEMSDPESGIAASSCFTTNVTIETGYYYIPCSATNGDGLGSNTYVVVHLDLTAPTVAFVGNEGAYEVDDTIAINCAAQDAVSGLATNTCVDLSTPAYRYPLGSHTLSATATDRAGHSTRASTTFTVTVTKGSLCGLTKQFMQGSAKYAALSPTQRAKTDQLLTTVCAQVTAISGTSTQKQSAITAYKRGVDALVSLGWLTASQGTTLKTLAAAL